MLLVHKLAVLQKLFKVRKLLGEVDYVDEVSTSHFVAFGDTFEESECRTANQKLFNVQIHYKFLFNATHFNFNSHTKSLLKNCLHAINLLFLKEAHSYWFKQTSLSAAAGKYCH